MAKKTGTTGNDTLVGTNAADNLFGLAGNDVLKGGSGNDYLDGGTGDDDLQGGAGNDIYIVDNAGDINKTLADPGIDAVGALINYTLGPQQENLTLLGTARLQGTGNNAANHLTGNDAVNILIGLGGDDVLDGHKGVDDLRGGKGDDLYLIDNAREINKTLADAGQDQVQSTVSYTLGTFQESLVLLGAAALSGNGNAGNNFILGNGAANVLHGGNGNDILVGGAGNDVLFGGNGDDRLEGGAGLDVLHGGAGDDHYTIDSTAELDPSELDPGNDTVIATGHYALGPNQENITFYDLDPAHPETHAGDGNSLDNVIIGGPLSDVLQGFGGNDRLDDGGPNLGFGHDQLVGGEGDDIYVIHNDGVIESDQPDPGDRDQVQSYITYTLTPQQEELVLQGTQAHDGYGNGGANLIIGNSAANILHGNDGADRIVGGGGADRLFGDDGNDTLSYEASAVRIDGGAGNGDALFVTGATSETHTNFDLTVIGDGVLTGLEVIRFAVNDEVASHTYTLKLTASDVLAMSDTTDTLIVTGETGDTVQMTGGSWMMGPDQILSDGKNYHAYSDGGAQLLIGEHITPTVS